jgi:predicted lipoprotein with Yx(FWY)xxD motif
VGALAATAVLSMAGGATAAPHRPAVSRATSTGTKVHLRRTARGKVLVAPNGHSLYDFTRDTRNTSHCGATCRLYWKPLMTKGRPVAGLGVKQSLLGQTTKHQVTYNHRPLYTYIADTRAGQIRGEDVDASGGYWYLMNARGHSVI